MVIHPCVCGMVGRSCKSTKVDCSTVHGERYVSANASPVSTGSGPVLPGTRIEPIIASPTHS